MQPGPASRRPETHKTQKILMSHKIARDQNRASPSSPSLASTFKTSVSLDAILTASSERYTPDKCFGLDVPYTNLPRHLFQPIPKGATAGSPLSPRSPRRVWGSPVNALPFAKSRSCPNFVLEEKFGMQGPSQSAPVGPWSCRECKTTDNKMLQSGMDSTMVCAACGTQAIGVAMIEQERAKNCPKDQDPTQVNDGAPPGTAKEAVTVALATGNQSSTEHKNMLQTLSGGTHMEHKTLKRSGLLNAGNALQKEAIKSLKEAMNERARDELVGRGILKTMEKLFEQIKGLDDRIAKHIRFALIHTYTASMMHASKCRLKGCMLALSTNTNIKLIVYSVTEQTMQDLIDASKLPEPPSDDKVATLARLTTGQVTLQQLEGQLTQVKQLKLKYGSPMNRIMASSAIVMISAWSEDGALKPCPESAPVALRQTPSVSRYPEEYGKRSAPDPGDVTPPMRDHVDQTAAMTQTRGDVRNTALSYLAEPKTVEFLTASEINLWSIGVIACLLLTCSAKKMGHKDETERLRKYLLQSEEISPTTFADAVASLATIMEDHHPEKVGDEIYACS